MPPSSTRTSFGRPSVPSIRYRPRLIFCSSQVRSVWSAPDAQQSPPLQSLARHSVERTHREPHTKTAGNGCCCQHQCQRGHGGLLTAAGDDAADCDDGFVRERSRHRLSSAQSRYPQMPVGLLQAMPSGGFRSIQPMTAAIGDAAIIYPPALEFQVNDVARWRPFRSY
jgi:hypothetical protein